jgi:hypothetical protein
MVKYIDDLRPKQASIVSYLANSVAASAKNGLDVIHAQEN